MNSSKTSRKDKLPEKGLLTRARRGEDKKYTAIVQAALDGFWVNDLEGRFLEVNDSYCRMVGYTREELLTMSISDVEALEKPEETDQRVRKIVEQGYDRFETRHRRKDGRIIDVEVSVNFIDTDGGQMFAFLHDITERKQMEEALRASEERYRTVIEGMRESLAIIGEDKRIEYVNPAVERHMGYKPEELMGERFDRFLTPESLKIAAESYEKRRRGEPVPSVYEVQAVTKDGALKDFEVSVSVCSEARKLKTVVVFEDVTDRKRMLRDLESYSERLEELVEERTKELRETEHMAAVGETAAMVGHDLRTPLQTVSNILHLMKSTPAGKKRAEFEEELMRQVNFMDRVVSNLQEYARPLKPELTETSLRQLINETLSTMRVPDNVQVSLTIPGDLRLMVDATLMRRVFTNLIANAIEAMPKGGKLTVTATRKREATYISVGDTGTGISEKMLGKIFRPIPTTKPGGTGLGLVIVKRLVDAQGGAVAVESQVGRGTVFTVKLPLRR